MKITERGWAGHFICANRCRFRRNTLIEGAGRRIVVSTVGGFFTNEGLQQIGHNRYYETMAFAAKDDGGYVEADVSEPLDIEGACGIYAERPEELPDQVDDYANMIHDKAVAEFAAQLSLQPNA